MAIVMAAVYLPGTLFRGSLPVQQVQPTTQFTVSPSLPLTQTSEPNLTDEMTISPGDFSQTTGELVVSCSVDQTSIIEGEAVTYSAGVSGGGGSYDYTWLSNSLPVGLKISSHEEVFDQSGTYSGISVQVESQDGSIEIADCPTVYVAPSMTASCSVSPTTVKQGESITWSAKTLNGTPPFTYEWAGINEIIDKTTQTFSTAVNTVGTQSSAVYVTDSKGAKATGKCDPITVEQKSLVFDPGVIGSGKKQIPGSSLDDSKKLLPGYQDASKVQITVECMPDKKAVYADQTVLWTVDVEGIDEADISAYEWSGDVKGVDKDISVKYTTPGTREAIASITYNGNEFSSDTCSVMVLPKPDEDEDIDDQDKTDEEDEETEGEEEQTVQTEDIAPDLSACGTPYPDDIAGHWAEAFIKRGYDLCLFTGIDGKFYPDRQATRLEAASMILYAKDLEPDTGCYDADCGTPFIDSPGIEAGSILRPLYYDDLVEGYNTYLFKPFSPITRAEAASLIVRAFFEPYEGCYTANCGAGWPDNFFNDITEMWQGQYIRVLWDKGIMTGSGPNRVEPNRYISRAEMAKMIVLAYENTH